jgi:hypothetical protein
MDITQILGNAQSADGATRQHAEATIEQAKSSNLVRPDAPRLGLRTVGLGAVCPGARLTRASCLPASPLRATRATIRLTSPCS